jgi:hypothetical protein
MAESVLGCSKEAEARVDQNRLFTGKYWECRRYSKENRADHTSRGVRNF